MGKEDVMRNLEFSYEGCKFIETVESNEETVDWSVCGRPCSWREVLDYQEGCREEFYLALLPTL